MVTTSKILSEKAKPRGKYPHYKRVGDYIFVSGTFQEKVVKNQGFRNNFFT